MVQDKIRKINQSALRDLMSDCYSINELKTLSTNLGIKYDSIPGETIETKVDGLINHLYERKRLQELLDELKKQRPREDWDSVYLPDIPPNNSNAGPWPETRGTPKEPTVPKRRILGAVAFITSLSVILLLVWFARTGSLCTYQGEDDYETIVQIIKAESLAVNSGNLDIINNIFAGDAYLMQIDNQAGTVQEWFDPLAHYRPLFENTKFSGALHNNIEGTVNGNSARFTSGSSGSYVADGQYGEYAHTAGDPREEEVWTLEKNFWGCWKITRFEFH